MRKLDLHGFTLEEAYQDFTDFIYSAYEDNISKVEIITGNSGQIKIQEETTNDSEIQHVKENVCFIAIQK